MTNFLLKESKVVEAIKRNNEDARLDEWCWNYSSGDVNKERNPGIPKGKCVYIGTNPNPNSFGTIYHREMARCYGLSAKAEYWDEWNAVHHASNDRINVAKYPDISVTATDKSIYGDLLLDKCAATVITNLIKERMTKMENNMTAKIELLNTFEKFAKDSYDDEIRKYLLATGNSPMEQEALKKSSIFDNIRHMLAEIKQDLMNSTYDREPKKYEPKVVCPVNIWENGNNTVVQWEDGTKTVVTAEHPESKSTFAGFCAALAKKIYGTTDKVMKQIDKAVENPKLPAKQRKEAVERIRAAREAEHKLRVKGRELRIKREMDQIYIEEEAKKRIDQARNERMNEQPKKKAKVNKKQTPKKEAKHE